MIRIVLPLSAWLLTLSACSNEEPGPTAGSETDSRAEPAPAPKAESAPAPEAESTPQAPHETDPESETTAAKPAISDADRADAKTHFAVLCVTCHGMSGKGDGPAGLALHPRPRNWTDKQWQKTVEDAHLGKVILEGGAAVGLSPLMPPNPQFKDRPGVIAALVDIVRSYGR